MKKNYYDLDIRAMKVFKICVVIIVIGVLSALAIYINTPTHKTAEVCRQALFGCAFGFDVALAGALYMDYQFKKNGK